MKMRKDMYMCYTGYSIYRRIVGTNKLNLLSKVIIQSACIAIVNN
jgi:hypothetical protein